MFAPPADTTFLDLTELDRYWDKIIEGRPQDYHGEAVNPKNLSLWERMLGRGKHYDPAKHAQEQADMAALAEGKDPYAKKGSAAA